MRALVLCALLGCGGLPLTSDPAPRAPVGETQWVNGVEQFDAGPPSQVCGAGMVWQYGPTGLICAAPVQETSPVQDAGPDAGCAP